jgi:peptide/nickel transport system substrate-binding protein
MNDLEGGSRRRIRNGRWFRAVGLGAAVAAALATAGCSAPSSDDSQTDDTLVYGWLYPDGYSATYDPAADGWAGDSLAQQCVYDTLLHYDFQNKEEWGPATPGLATDWTISPDLMSIELQLREGVTFTDGAIFDAAAVKANIDFQIAQSTWFDAPVDKDAVEILDDYRVRINFDQELPVALPQGIYERLQLLMMVSPEALEDRETLAEHPVGTGPYTLDLEETTFGVEYVCNRIDDYWDVESFPFETVIVRQYPDVISATNALKSGQIDVTLIDPTVAAELEGGGFTVVRSHPNWSGLQIGDKTGAIVPALGDVRVRQAMNYAFDRETIAATVDGGYAVPTNQAYSSIWPEYLPDRTDEYAYDPEKARELMAEAGYADGFDLVIPQWGPGTKYDPIIAQSLGEIGIRVTFETRQDQGTEYNPGMKYAVMVWQGAAYEITNVALVTTVNTFYNPWPTGETVTAELFDKIRFGDAEESKAAGQELGNYILDQAWFVPITSPENLMATKPGIVADFHLALGPYLATIRPE